MCRFNLCRKMKKTLYKRYTYEDIDFLKNNFPFRGTQYCAKVLGRSPQSVASTAHKFGLKVHKKFLTTILETAFTKRDDWYKININQFRNISSPHVAYFLGYFWADGHVKIKKRKAYAFSFLIQHKDFLAIKPTLDTMGIWGTHTYPNPNSKKHQLMTKVYTGNKPLVLWLIDMDYGDKSWVAPTKILNHIPDHLRHYWWRGYMDGDGSWRTKPKKGNSYQFCFCANYYSDYTEHVNILESMVINYFIERTIKKYSRSSKMICSNLEGTYRWGEYIYAGYPKDGIGLKRKWEKWIVSRDRFDLYRRINEIQIVEHPDTVVTPELLYQIIKRHNGLITRGKLVEHFNTVWWKIRDRLRVLFKDGRVKPIDNALAKRYMAI